MACLFHDFNNLVERDTVETVREGGIDIGVEGAGGGVGITFDAWYLHKSADRVAGHAEVMFKPHLRCIFDLRRRTAEELCRGSGSHGTRHTNLSLASHFGTADGGVVFHHVAKQSGSGESPEDARLAEVLALAYMIEHTGQHSARPACGSRHDASAGSILFAYCQCVGEDEGTCADVVAIAGSLDVVRGGLTCEMERSGQHALGIDASLYGFAHHLPHVTQIVPDLFSLTFFYILPKAFARFFAVSQNLCHCVQMIYLRQFVALLPFFFQSPASDTVNRPAVDDLAICIESFELHTVGMVWKENVRHPSDGGVLQNIKYGDICHVSSACGSEAAVERHDIRCGFLRTPDKYLSSFPRPHGMTA